MLESYDAIVVGSGPNGLAAAIRLQQHGCNVLVIEGKEEIGGGTRTAALLRPGFRHDICSAIHPMAVGSPFLTSLPLEDYGLRWIHPELPVVHPLSQTHSVALHRDVNETAAQFSDPKDRQTYRKIFDSLAKNWDKIAPDLLAPLGIPKHPLLLAKMGWHAKKSAKSFLEATFQTPEARALIAGHAAHSVLSLEQPFTAAPALLLMSAGHAVGWPFPEGGAHAITKAMASYFKSLGGSVETGRMISNLNELPSSQAYLMDITPAQLLEMKGTSLPNNYRQKLEQFRYNHGSFKVDLILREPIPWSDPVCRQSATVHIGGTADEIITSERTIAADSNGRKPYVILAQHSLFDSTRTPKDSSKHTVWAYCHVPAHSTRDYREAIFQQIERFAPGFRDLIEEVHITTAQGFQTYNPNYIGGDINGGVQDMWQLFRRPGKWINPYQTPQENLYLCSSSTPPGGGVHGMCGFHAAESAIKKHF
jgi:phytoene dehydrogenase-like protein